MLNIFDGVLSLKIVDQTLNLDSLQVQFGPVSHLYQQFGRVAGLSPDKLDIIVSSTISSYDGLIEVRDLWLLKCRREKTSPIWRAVAEMMVLIGDDKLSDELLQVYKTGKTGICYV